MELELTTTLAAAAWWTGQEAGILGGIAGGVLGGVGGGVIGGVAIPLLVTRGRHKSVALGLLAGLVLLGLVALALGATALLGGQPWHVWFVPLQIGFVMTVVGGGLVPAIAARYRAVEARGMEAALIRGETATRPRVRPPVLAGTAVCTAAVLGAISAAIATAVM